jgi:5'-3' exonuclease
METRPVLLIDFSALFRRAWAVASEMSVAYEATVSGVNRADHMMPNALVAICCDGRGNWRKEISKDYKAHREQQPQSMYGEIDRTIERLKKDGRLVWKFDGFEADDIIATAAMMAQTRGHTVRIATHDKDLMQLLGPSCDMLATHIWEVVGADKVREKFGVDPEQLGDWLALVGDKSDEIKGCPGIGATKATKLLLEYGNLQGIWECLDPPPGTEPKRFVLSPTDEKSLRANVLNVEQARKLVTLRTDVPLKFDDIYNAREIQPLVTEEEEMEQEADELLAREDAPKGKQPEDPETVNSGRTEEQTPGDRSGSDSTIKAKVEDADLKAAVDPRASADVVKSPGETPEGSLATSAPAVTSLVQVEYTKQLEPRSFSEANFAARIFFNSRVYSRYPDHRSMIAAIVRGREMGYGMGASLDMFHVADFNNTGDLRLILHAHAIIDMVMKDPGIEYFMLVESNADHATYEAKVKRNPKPTSLTYTIEDAKAANLVRLTQKGKPNNWMMRPSELLRKTCGVQLGRIVSPGRALGLYCFEEMGIDE